MKNLIYCLLALTTLTFFSCQKDTDNLTAKTKNLIGTWEAKGIVYINGQSGVRDPEISVALASNGSPLLFEFNKDETFQAFGDEILLTGTYMAKRARGKYHDGTKFLHGDIKFDFVSPAAPLSTTDSVLISVLRHVETYSFNGERLSIYSQPDSQEGWSMDIDLDRR